MTTEFCMPALLRKWALERTTGTLTVSAPHPAEVVATVLVENGGVVFATVRNRRDPTGELYLMLFQAPDIDSVDPDEAAIVRAQVTTVVADLFDWAVAEIHFQDGINLIRWPHVELSHADLMLAGMRRVTDVGRVRKWLGDRDQVFVRSDDPFKLLRGASLRPEEAYLISRVEEPMTVDEICESAGMDGDIVVRTVAALLFLGVLEPAAISRQVREAVPHPKPQPTVDPAEAARFWYQVENKLRAVEAGIDYYGLLEVERRAPLSEIEHRYNELTRSFHPEWYKHLAPLYADVDGKLDAIFKSLTAAYAVLSNPVNRQAYDRMLAGAEKQGAIRVDVPTQGRRTAPLEQQRQAPRPAEPPTPARSQPSAPPPSPSPQKAAPLAGERDAEQKVPELTPAEWYKRGLEFLNKKDYDRAVSAFERGLALKPQNAQLHSALGRALTLQGTKPKRAEEVLRRAIHLAPFSATPLVELGMLYLRTGRKDDAKTCFEQALTIKPDESRAQAALEQIKGAPGGTSALLKKLFTS